MMKIRKKLRSNGGYALVYAVVAMTLMLAVVAGLTLTSVRGLRTQQAAVESLQKRYEAAGEMEEVFAKIAKYTFTPTSNVNNKIDAVSSFKTDFEKLGNILEFQDPTDEKGSIIVKVSSSDEAKVTADLSVTYEVKEEDKGTGGTPAQKTYTFTVTSVSYQSYSYTEATT